MAPTLSTPLPLRIDSLIKRFGQVTAVDGITIELQPGECLGLLGPNGAGKSTLIRSIAGRVIPDSGSVSVFGAPASTTAARNALGWVPQELALYRRLTCRENLVSSGLIHRPKLVLMDEPTTGVDPQSRNRIFEMIEKLRADGMSIVYTTHYMEEAERLCDRIAIVDRGRIVALGSREELVHQAFASRSQVLARFAGPADRIAAWVEGRGGTYVESHVEGNVAGHTDNRTDKIVQFTVEQPTEIV